MIVAGSCTRSVVADIPNVTTAARGRDGYLHSAPPTHLPCGARQRSATGGADWRGHRVAGTAGGLAPAVPAATGRRYHCRGRISSPTSTGSTGRSMPITFRQRSESGATAPGGHTIWERVPPYVRVPPPVSVPSGRFGKSWPGVGRFPGPCPCAIAVLQLRSSPHKRPCPYPPLNRGWPATTGVERARREAGCKPGERPVPPRAAVLTRSRAARSPARC